MITTILFTKGEVPENWPADEVLKNWENLWRFTEALRAVDDTRLNLAKDTAEEAMGKEPGISYERHFMNALAEISGNPILDMPIVYGKGTKPPRV